MCYVNGKRVEDRQALKSGDRVIFGKSHVFRYINPEQVRKEKSNSATTPTSSNPMSDSTMNVNNGKQNKNIYLLIIIFSIIGEN